MTTATLSEFLTIEEMSRRFPGEWALIVDVEANGQVTGGRVAAHSTDKNDVEDVAEALQPTTSAVRFLGALDQGLDAVL